MQIKCPICGAKLNANVPEGKDLSKITFTCPVCNVVSPLSGCERIVPKPARPVPPKPVDDPETRYEQKKQEDTPGYFVDERNGNIYRLRPGKYTVGRKTYESESRADIPIETVYNGILEKTFSRVHFYVNTVLGTDGIYHTYISNASNKDDIKLNGKILGRKEELGLQDGDKIYSGGVMLRFVKTAPASSSPSAGDDIEDGTII